MALDRGSWQSFRYQPPDLPLSLQVGGAAVMAVGIWTLVEKSGYLSILASSTFAASAYILIFAGALVMTTGFLGFGAIIREQKSCLSVVSVLLSLCGDCFSTGVLFHGE